MRAATILCSSSLRARASAPVLSVALRGFAGTATPATATAAQLKQESRNKLFNPTDEHTSLREMIRGFVEAEVDPQALEFNRLEKFNIDLFKKLGSLGLLGITVDPQYGGSGMDAVAAVIAHGGFLQMNCVAWRH
jgi:alkylation response protein AidB-like acyl-CoA dehydrogenase